jgi:hypothetical protein
MTLYTGQRASIYFGDVDTDELSVVVAGDSSSQTSNWTLSGVSASNTLKYKLWWEIKHVSSDYIVNLYKASTKQAGELVASGSITTATGYIVLRPQNSSGMAGMVSINYAADDTDTSNTLTSVTKYDLGAGPFAMKVNKADGITYVTGVNATQIKSMRLFGLTALNTDHYRLYWTLTNIDTTRTINIYKDSGHSELVATGSHIGDGTVLISAANSSGIRGEAKIEYTEDTTDVSNVAANGVQYVFNSATDRKTMMWWAEANATLIVEIGSGATWTAIDTTKCRIQHLGGIVTVLGSYVATDGYNTAAVAGNTSIQVKNVAYWTVTKMGEANSWSLQVSRDIADKSVLGNNGWKEYFPILRGANVTLEKWFETDNQFYDVMGKKVIMVLWVTFDDDALGNTYTGSGYACYARSKSTAVGASPTAIIREQLQLDVLSKLYYLDIQ